MKRRLLSILLALAMCLSLAPTGWAEDAATGNVASVTATINGTETTTKYSTIEEACKAIEKIERPTITLLTDVKLEEPLDLKGLYVTLDGNDHTITYDPTVTTHAYNYAIRVYTHNLTIRNCSINATFGGSLYVSSGTLYIKDGSFTGNGENNLYIRRTGTVQLSGGTYTNSNSGAPSISTEGERLHSLLADGYSFVEGDSPLDDLNVTSLSGTVTVKCTHSQIKYTPNSDGHTHKAVCENCGETNSSEECTSNHYESAGEAAHQFTCSYCSANRNEKHDMRPNANGITGTSCTKCSYSTLNSEMTIDISDSGSLMYGSTADVKATCSVAANVDVDTVTWELYRVPRKENDTPIETNSETGFSLPANLSAGKYDLYCIAKSTDGQITAGTFTTFTINPMPVSIDVEVKPKTYDGSNHATAAVKNITGKNGQLLNDIRVTGVTGTFRSSNAGKYMVDINIDRAKIVNMDGTPNPNYTISTPAVVEGTIAKAEPRLVQLRTPEVKFGQELTEEILELYFYEECPSNNEPVKGTWTWTENGILFGITKDYTLTFTPENSDNFTQLSVNHDNIIVDVQPADPNLTLTVDTAQQKPGGEVNVTVSASNPYNNDPDIQPEVEVVYQIADGEEKAVTGGKFIIPAGTAPGTEITITARVDGTDKKYVASTASASVTVVNEDTIFVTISGVEVNDKIYDGKKIEPSGAPVIKDESGNSVNAAVKNYIWADASGAKLEDAPVNKGTYTLTMKVEGYAVKNLPIKFEIKQATLTIAAENKAATKGGTIPELTYTMTSSGGTKPTLKTEPKLHCTATKDSEPGTYDITISGAEISDPEKDNYEIKYVPGQLQINGQSTVIISGVAGTEKVYDGNHLEPVIDNLAIIKWDNTNVTSSVPVADINYVWKNANGESLPAPIDVGEYTLTLEINTEDYGGKSAPIPFKITPVLPRIDAAGETPTVTLEYGKKLSDVDFTGLTVKDPVNDGKTLKGTWAWDSNVDADSAPIKDSVFYAKFVPESGNYQTLNNIPVSVKLQAVKPLITIDAPNIQKAGQDMTVTVSVKNPNNEGFHDLPVAKVSYQIDSGAKTDVPEAELADGEFTISVPAECTAITITAATDAVDGKYTASTAEPVKVTVTNKSIVNIAFRETPTLTSVYDGRPVSIDTSSEKLKFTDTESGGLVGNLTAGIVWNTTDGKAPVNAGKYTFKLKLAESEGYTGESDPIEYEITKAKPVLTIMVSPNPQKPGGAVTVTTAAFNPNNTALTDVPAAKITCQATGGEATALTGGTFTIPADAKKGTVYTFTASLDESDNYTAADPATAQVIVIDPEADKTQVTVTPSATEWSKVYDGQAAAFTGTVEVKAGNEVLSVTPTPVWTTAGGEALASAPVNAGTYKLTLKVDTERYTGQSAAITVTIEQAEITITADDKTAQVGDALPALTHTVSGLVGEDKLKTEPQLTCEAKNTNTKGEFKITASGAAAPDTGNYKTEIKYVDGKLTVTDSNPIDPNKATPAGAPTASDITFGETVSKSTLKGEMKAGETVVPGDFAWAEPDVKPVAGGYTAKWTFTPKDTALYNTASGTATIKVNPAKLTGEPAFTKVEASGKTLADIKLTAPDGWPEGTFKWTDADTTDATVVEQGKEYSYTFTANAPNDTNYEPYTGKVTPWAKADDPDNPDNPDPPSTTTKLEIKDGLTEVPEALRNISYLDTPAKMQSAMENLLTQRMGGVPVWNTAFYDVTLMVSADGGDNWVPATRDNFPASGRITVTIPYPAGTDSSYQFAVVHMFTTSDFGRVPGGMETPYVYNTVYGIQFDVTGLSPIAVSWTAPTVAVRPGQSGDSAVIRPGAEVRPVNPSNSQPYPNAPEETVKPAGYSCGGGASCPSRAMYDVSGLGTWYHTAIDYVLENGLMNGYDDGTFGPYDHLSRAMVAQILYNKENRPAVAGGRFSDVPGNAWYAQAVAWASIRGIVTGYGSGRFGPEDYITREQLAIMLWRYAWRPSSSLQTLPFDVGQAGADSLGALRWAVENNILTGASGVMDPYGLATRAETAQILMNFMEWQQGR